MLNDELLKIFLNHSDQWLSGNQLAEQMNVSRTMVWKRIKALRDAGHHIEAKSNLGYRYLGTNQLDAQTIEHRCQQPVAVQVFDQIGSTNQTVKNLINQHPLATPIAVIANQQTAGYGRRGRQFYSPANSGLYLTIAVPVDHHTSIDPGLLTTTTAVAVVKALKQSYPAIDFKLKWINDIWVDGQKVGGIMTESIMDIELMQPSAIIVGIGLNLSTNHFPDDINQPVASISPRSIDRNQLTADIINQFLAVYPHYQAGTAMAEYRRLSVVIGQQVTIQTHRGELVGTVETIADNGALVLRDSNGKIHNVMTGEVTKVRLQKR
ncbi:biotin--[acetyl-CoA-carboxylase] ligase [Lactobacillaceae bacterium Melli_B4]